MLKKWHENSPFVFGFIVMFLYIAIPKFDTYISYPKIVPKCKGQITDVQIRACVDWIHKKGQDHVRTTKRGFGELYRDSPGDELTKSFDDFGGK